MQRLRRSLNTLAASAAVTAALVTASLPATTGQPRPAAFSDPSAYIDPLTPSAAAPQTGAAKPNGGAWTVTFSDEFNDTAIDTGKWRIVDSDRGLSGTIHRYWRPENISEIGGFLAIRFKKDSCANCYSSGAVDTYNHWRMTYGYLEARISITPVEGKQSAFWMMPASGTTLPGGVADGTADDGAELDIVEANRHADQYATNIHWDGYAETHHSSHVQVDAPGLHQNRFNIFGLEWSPQYLKFYVNGTLVRTVSTTSQIPDVAEYPILSGGIFGTAWVDGEITTATLPSYGYVDWIRIYQ